MAVGAIELPLLDHAQGLDSRDQSTRAVEVLEAEHGPHDSFERPVILLDEVVQILGRPRRIPLNAASVAGILGDGGRCGVGADFVTFVRVGMACNKQARQAMATEKA